MYPWIFPTALLLSSIDILQATSGSNSNSPNFNPFQPHFPDDNDDKKENEFQNYSINRHVSFDPKNEKVSISSETSSVAFFESNHESSRQPSIDSAFIEISECRMGNSFSYSEDEDEDEDDSDDEDNDGHSMMLSNASLRRPLITACGVVPDSSTSGTSSGEQKKQHDVQNLQKSVSQIGESILSQNLIHRKLKQPKSGTQTSNILSIRGGAMIPLGSEFLKKLFVAATITLVYEGIIGHFLEFLKIVMQTSPVGFTYLDAVRQITAGKGIAGCWDGFVPWGVIQAVGKGGVFGLAHAVALAYLLPLSNKDVLPKQLALTLAGGIAGGFQGYVISPTLLLKTRVMTNPVFREKMSLLRTTILSLRIGLDVVLHEGVFTLMKGANVFALKRVFDWATRFYFSDCFELFLLSRSTTGTLTPFEKISASLLGGMGSTLSTVPLDVLVTQTQDAKKAGIQVSAIKMFTDEFKEKGLKRMRDRYSSFGNKNVY